MARSGDSEMAPTVILARLHVEKSLSPARNTATDTAANSIPPRVVNLAKPHPLGPFVQE